MSPNKNQYKLNVCIKNIVKMFFYVKLLFFLKKISAVNFPRLLTKGKCQGQEARKLTKHYSLTDPIGFCTDSHQSSHMYP